ncbi:MAG: Phage gp6-like head-tail connector protein [Pseudomonadota bacterium]|jgi:hypothetical protein
MYAKFSVIEHNLDYLLSTKIIKDYLRIDDNFDDDLLLLYLKTAEAAAENIIGDYVSEKVIEIVFDSKTSSSVVDLSNPKVVKLIDVLDLNSNKVDYDYSVLNNILTLKQSVLGDVIKVVCKVGCSAMQISNDIRFAVLNHVGYIYQNKGSDVAFVPQNSLDVYFSHKKSFKL